MLPRSILKIAIANLCFMMLTKVKSRAVEVLLGKYVVHYTSKTCRITPLKRVKRFLITSL